MLCHALPCPALPCHALPCYWVQIIQSETDGHVMIENFKKSTHGVKGKLGQPFWNMLYICPVKGPKGDVIKWVGVLNDVRDTPPCTLLL